MGAMKLFGISLERLAADAPEQAVVGMLSHGRGLVVTLNPEMALESRHDPALRAAINGAAVILADGAGVQWAAGKALGRKVARLTGVDAMERLLVEASERRLKVAFVGGSHEDAEQAAAAVLKRFPGTHLISVDPGIVRRQEDGSWEQPAHVRERLAAFKPDILAVALGHGKQETWIADHLPLLPSVRVAIGVGGTFAFLAGRIRRAPALMRSLGLEWAWRLLQEPHRIGRIFRAVVIFPTLVFWDRIRGL